MGDVRSEKSEHFFFKDYNNSLSSYSAIHWVLLELPNNFGNL
jgi:hypothetical protein